MRDTKKPLRLAIFNALAGVIEYNSLPVNIVDEKMRASNPDDLYVILGQQTETSTERNDGCFITESTIEMEIVHRPGFEVSKDAMDEVYQDILSVILPNPNEIGLTVPVHFQFNAGFRESCFTQFTIEGTSSVLRQIFRLKFIITQK